ncbi:hypothetical protein EDD21DRAFT_79587 [Dissophora ornata]|nr:hypothetical protein EDD21DRAFT_79587 [Dissophora ornata]
MGLNGWFPFIRRMGYNPVPLYQSVVANIATNRRRRLDVLGTCYCAIRNSYSNTPQDVAHRMLEQEVSRFGSSLDMTLYIDGYQAVEKSDTAAEREGLRKRALERTTTALGTLESRLDQDLRVRKRHFVDVRSGLASSFYWSRESRLEFAQYMQDAGWTVKVADTEADLAIAIDAEPNDITISGDSDMIAYASIRTLWRPVSGGCILVYTVQDLLRALDVTRSQLTALAVVSRNDYNKNIRSLGPATNFSIIKSIKRADPKDIVLAYYLTAGLSQKTPTVRTLPCRSKSLWIFNKPGLKLTDPSLVRRSCSSNYKADFRISARDMTNINRVNRREFSPGPPTILSHDCEFQDLLIGIGLSNPQHRFPRTLKTSHSSHPLLVWSLLVRLLRIRKIRVIHH